MSTDESKGSFAFLAQEITLSHSILQDTLLTSNGHTIQFQLDIYMHNNMQQAETSKNTLQIQCTVPNAPHEVRMPPYSWRVRVVSTERRYIMGCNFPDQTS